MTVWTKEQQSAIDTRDCDLLVSAAAGSGKTAVLSERVLKRVTDEKAPLSVDRLLVVTFTNAAAAEMRQRIVDKLRAELVNNPENKTISKQLSLVPKASITTIHQFCLNLIKNNFHLLDIDPSFKILDDGENELIKTDTAIKTMNCMYEKYGSDFSDVVLMISGGNDQEFVAEMLRIYNYICSFENPLKWLDDAIEEYNLKDENPDNLPWTELLKTKFKVILSKQYGMYEKAEKYADMAGCTNYFETFNQDKNYISNLMTALNGDVNTIKDSASKLTFVRLAPKNKDCDPDLATAAKICRDDIKNVVKSVCDEILCSFTDNTVTAVKNTYKYLKIFGETIFQFDKLFKDTKYDKKAIDFNDFEHFALKLLQDENLPVAKEISEKFDEIYVDEYQDCNGVQEAIFSAISRKSPEGKSCNMFMVGDIKQSIYRFRHADPTIFIGKLNSYKKDGIQRKIMLNKNFRSRPQVVECINNLFSKIMSEELGSIDYTDDEALYAGFSYPDEDVWCGGNPEIIGVLDDSDYANETSITLQARAVGCKIREMVGKFMVYDAKNQCYRPSKYNDFAVLLRSGKGKTNDIEQEFKAQNIPYFLDKSAGLFETLEIDFLISVLSVIDNPLQDIPLLGIMRSPVFDFNENELLKIKLYKNKKYFYNCLISYAKKGGKLSEKCSNFISLINLWRKESKVISLSRLLIKIMEDISFNAYILALPGGKNRIANVMLLLEYAKQFDKADMRGVFAFMKYISRVKKSSKESETARILSDNCDVVKIMSIHRSKGLEFPVVFVMDISKKFNDKDWTGNNLMLHKNYGIGCSYFDKNKNIKYPLISRGAVSYRIMLDSLSEEMRVLYVALTRAREKLFVTFSGKTSIEKVETNIQYPREGKPLRGEVEWSNSFLDWILLALKGTKSDSSWKFTSYTKSQLEKMVSKLSKPCVKYTDESTLYNKLNENLSYKYPYKGAEKLSSKYSVTEVKKKFNEEDAEGNKFRFSDAEILPSFMREEKITSTALGTLYHLVLKFIDFNETDYTKAYDNAVNYLKDNSFISDAEGENLKSEIVINFLKSDCAQIIRKAEKVFREIPFNICVSGSVPTKDKTFENENVLLQGIIDCLVLYKDCCYVIDYKTESNKMSADELTKIYKEQIDFYKLAAEKITGMPVKAAYLYYLNRGKSAEC